MPSAWGEGQKLAPPQAAALTLPLSPRKSVGRGDTAASLEQMIPCIMQFCHPGRVPEAREPGPRGRKRRRSDMGPGSRIGAMPETCFQHDAPSGMTQECASTGLPHLLELSSRRSCRRHESRDPGASAGTQGPQAHRGPRGPGPPCGAASPPYRRVRIASGRSIVEARAQDIDEGHHRDRSDEVARDLEHRFPSCFTLHSGRALRKNSDVPTDVAPGLRTGPMPIPGVSLNGAGPAFG